MILLLLLYEVFNDIANENISTILWLKLEKSFMMQIIYHKLFLNKYSLKCVWRMVRP